MTDAKPLSQVVVEGRQKLSDPQKVQILREALADLIADSDDLDDGILRHISSATLAIARQALKATE